MKTQKNFRFDDRTLAIISEMARENDVSDTEIVERAIWCLYDVLNYGDNYENKISSLKHAISMMLLNLDDGQ